MIDLKRRAKLGALLRGHREVASLSLNKAARALGVTATYLSRVEHGLASISADRLDQLAGLYGWNQEEYDAVYWQAGQIPEDVRKLVMAAGGFQEIRNWKLKATLCFE